jgi:hypothetical protein
MRSRDAQRLVIDTDIVRSAPVNAMSMHPCREFLETIRKVGHFVVMTPKLKQEWNRHISRYASRWLVQMQDRRRIYLGKGDAYASLPEQIQSCGARPAQKEAMLKDAHLIAAAVETDRRVVSMDETARGLFRKHSDTLERLRDVVWVNPAREEDTPIEWLKAGAPPDEDRMLGAETD